MPSKDGDGGTAATGNVPQRKMEKGQARRERRAKAAAAAERGDDEEAETEVLKSSVGAYVHISRISDERVEHVERMYKPGQKVR